MKNMVKDAVMLFVITLVAGLVLGFVYQITKDPIAKQQQMAKEKACKEVFATAESFGQVDVLAVDEAAWREQGFEQVEVNEVSQALDGNGNLLGYVITMTSHAGYGGDIQFSMGVQMDGTLNGLSLLSISETAGLGMKAGSVLVPQFADKKVEQFAYTKTGAVSDDQIDAISGATITTKAVTYAVNGGLYYFHEVLAGGDAE